MSEGSSHRAGTTANTYTDLGAHTEEAYAISSTSRKLARQVIGDNGPEDRVRQRCSIAVGDMDMAKLLRFHADPINAGRKALERNAPIFCDIRMVQVGLQKRGHRSEVLCLLDFGLEDAKSKGITRTRAGMAALGKRLDGGIVVIGNAPSCLLELCQMFHAGIRPALVVGCPVGFVNAAESKEELRQLDLPSITTEGTRGGSPVAVAAINEIITIFAEMKR